LFEIVVFKSTVLAGKSKSIPIKACIGPEGARISGLPEFLDNRHKEVERFLHLRTGLLYSQDIFIVLISVRVTVRPEELSQ
jgi:hypothetical protein